MTRNAEVLLFSVRSGRLRQLQDYIASGFKQVELGGKVTDPFIRCSKIAARLDVYSWQQSAVADQFDLLGNMVIRDSHLDKLGDDWKEKYELVPMFSPSGYIVKVVLVKLED